MKRRRYTTRAEDALFLAQRYADAQRNWKVGETCASYDGRSTTTITAIDGEIATLANGDTLHLSKVRRAR